MEKCELGVSNLQLRTGHSLVVQKGCLFSKKRNNHHLVFQNEAKIIPRQAVGIKNELLNEHNFSHLVFTDYLSISQLTMSWACIHKDSYS